MDPLISACLIVKNEEKNLSRCLHSIVDKVDEIIVVDTGSSDSTVACAKIFTDKVYYFPWINDFSAARNESLAYAQYDWVFVIDADEVLDSTCNLQQLIRDNPHATAFTLKEIDVTPDSEPVSISVSSERLFLRKNARYDALVHNALTLQKPLVVHHDSVLYHYGYNMSDAELITKYEPRLPLLEERCRCYPSFESDYYLASTYLILKRYNDAYAVFEKITKKYPRFERQENIRTGINICFLDFVLNNPDKGYSRASHFFEATNRPIFLFFKGIFASKIGKYTESESDLSLVTPDDDFLSIPDHRRLIAYARGINAFFCNNIERAQHYFNEYIASHSPGEGQLLATADTYVAINRTDLLESLASDLEKCEQPHAWALRALYAEKSGDLPGAVQWYNRALAHTPKSALYNALGVVLFRLKDTERAVEIIKKAVTCSPVDMRAFDNLMLIYKDVLHDETNYVYWEAQRNTMKGTHTV